MTLQFLLFDQSEGGDGTGAFEAMAAVLPAQAGAVEAEIAAVLDWAGGHFGVPAPLEDGGEWHAEVQCSEEADGSGTPRRVFSLSLAGSAAFCAAFESRFGDALA
ncbi:hypothetical protein [Pseudorhodoferax sp. Leaf274]|uniref:hypothetical protein n=1 Tax=Pseudorhodoferax sp. Leaf274 TaxID=1736318 RepID=UPI00070359E6|nr:hypothetical protein [Pseudorhodoferax sp. Leaf274]KQP36240.1 hypothetical protein ASF44_16900 [Pseudorhodoferax sp. Leaf274]